MLLLKPLIFTNFNSSSSNINSIMYADDTILTRGKYKFTALCRVPPEYLLNLYAKKNKANPELYEYIEKNLSLIKSRAIGALEIPELQIVCKKIVYSSEKVAKAELKRISEMKNDHKSRSAHIVVKFAEVFI